MSYSVCTYIQRTCSRRLGLIIRQQPSLIYAVRHIINNNICYYESVYIELNCAHGDHMIALLYGNWHVTYYLLHIIPVFDVRTNYPFIRCGVRGMLAWTPFLIASKANDLDRSYLA